MPGKRKVVQFCDGCHKDAMEHFVSRVQDRTGVSHDEIDPICRECMQGRKRHRIVYRGRDTQRPDKMGKWNDHHDEGVGLETGVAETGRKRGGGTLAMQDPESATQVDTSDEHMEADEAEAAGYTLDNRIPWWIESLVEGRGLYPQGIGGRMEKKFRENIRGFDFDGVSPQSRIDMLTNAARKAVLDTTYPGWVDAVGPDADFQTYRWFGQEPMYSLLRLPAPEPTMILNKDGDIRPVKKLTAAEKLEKEAEEMRKRWAIKPRRGRKPKFNSP